MSLFDHFGLSDDITFGTARSPADASYRLVRELVGRFRHYHNHRKDKGGAPLFVVVGHSFGGMIVYSALAQAASVPADEVTPRFADLVLLVSKSGDRARSLPANI